MRTIMMLLVAVFGMSACTFASVESRRPGRYHINGYAAGNDVVDFHRAASDSVVNEMNAECLRKWRRLGMVVLR